MTGTRKTVRRGGSAADISKSIGLARTLASRLPPLDVRIVLLDYMHGLKAELDRRAARAGAHRSIAWFSSSDLVFSITDATELAALCSRPRVSKVLEDYITSLADELDRRYPGSRAASKANSRENRKEDVAHDE